MASKTDLYTSITNTIIQSLEQGVRPWHKPWKTSTPLGRPLRANGIPYTGINVLILWDAIHKKQFNHATWMTFKQAQALGAQVRKGEKGTKIVFSKKMKRIEKNEDGEEVTLQIPFLKSYTVFNLDQIDGLPDEYVDEAVEELPEVERLLYVDSFIAHTGAKIIHGGNHAFYSPSLDQITMPHIECFEDRESYYSTLCHESIHWTMLPTSQAGYGCFAMTNGPFSLLHPMHRRLWIISTAI